MYRELIDAAREAQGKAYVPYSEFRVGAALLTKDHKVFTGCNIENVSYGATCCAERVAIFKAVSQDIKSFQAIAVTSSSQEAIFPCGICRQVMVEFKIPKVIVVDGNGKYKEFALEELMPYAFDEYS